VQWAFDALERRLTRRHHAGLATIAAPGEPRP
jgi:hypothetical protein